MYTATDKMATLMSGDPQVLRVISRFNIPLGVGEKTIEEVCKDKGVDVGTFLTIVNYTIQPSMLTAEQQKNISLSQLMQYLRQSHAHFFEFSLPMLRRKLIEAINYSSIDSRIPMLIIQYFDEYVNEISVHMQHENEQVFPYVEGLMNGEKTDDYSIQVFAEQHRAVDDQNIAQKLTELKQLIIKYYPQTGDNALLMSALYDLFLTESDIAKHCDIEDNILLPAVKMLENTNKKEKRLRKKQEKEETEELSDREKDILIEVVNGLSNKEIADKLYISIHTVISHRKNISRKLNIHSTAGLTIYAIVNNLVDINQLG